MLSRIRRALEAPAESGVGREPQVAMSWRRDILEGVLLSAGCLGLILVFTDLKTEGTVLYRDPGWDRHLYRLMAEEGLFDFRLAPYCWRVLMPALAGWSPASLQASFMGMTLAALLGVGVVLYLMVRGRGHPRFAAALGVILFYSLGWGPKFIMADFWIPDGLAFLLVALGLWAALERRLYLFGAVMVAGALTKESVLLAAPLYFCLNVRRPLDWRFVARCAAVLIPAGAIVLALRLGVAQENGDAAYLATMPEDIRRFPELYGPYNYWTLLQDIGHDQRVRYWGFDAFLSYTTSPLGLALPLLAGLGLRRSWRMALAMLPFFLLTYAQLLFATDTQRLLVLVSPCLAILAMEGVRELQERFGVSPKMLLPAAVALFLLVLIGRDSYEVRFESQALILGLAMVVLFAYRRGAPGDRLPGRGEARDGDGRPDF